MRIQNFFQSHLENLRSGKKNLPSTVSFLLFPGADSSSSSRQLLKYQEIPRLLCNFEGSLPF